MSRRRVRKSPRITVGKLFLFVGVPLIAACLMFIYLYTFVRVRYVPVEPVVVTDQVQAVERATAISAPVRLKIMSIDVDTTIKRVGLTSDGDMAVDDNPDVVGWYKAGPKPGEPGSAVIAGHYGWDNGHGSVFNSLHVLKPGDKVIVYDQKGAALSFIVRDTRSYKPEADATKVFKSTDHKAHLNLITCEGAWVGSENSYSDRLVVFTDLAD